MMLSNGNLLACSGLCLYVTTSDRVDKKTDKSDYVKSYIFYRLEGPCLCKNLIYFIDSKVTDCYNSSYHKKTHLQ